MCGIAGEVSFRGKNTDPDHVISMTANLSHRGPDGEGLHTSSDRRACLGHRRLAIIGLGDSGKQPMFSSDGRYTLVFNGEIYNFRELRVQLETKGFKFHGDSDSEVLLSSFVCWGVSAFGKLRGMFALAIWDDLDKKLTLARDRIGIKPLFVHRHPDGIRFCSELDPLRRVMGTQKINRQALSLFLHYRFIPGSKTIIEDIEKVQPGTYWEVDSHSGSISETKFWNLFNIAAESIEIPISQVGRVLEEKISETVNLHLRSDVDYGLMLSGGLDSSVLLKHIEQQSGPFDTFTCRIGEQQEEAELARNLSKKYSTNHHECEFAFRELVSSLQLSTAICGNLLADSSVVPYLHLSRFASKHVKVVMGGDGGDELFSGYKWYLPLRYRQLEKYFVGTASLFKVIGNPALQRLYEAQYCSGQSRHDLLRGIAFDTSQISNLVKQPFEKELGSLFPTELDSGIRHRCYDLATFTVDSILYKVDAASMAYGLEVRVPFLDHELVELAMKIPSGALIKWFKGKKILRDLYARDLTRGHMHAPKQGFSLSLRAWEKQLYQLAWECLPSGVALKKGVLDKQSVLNCLTSRHYRSVTQIWVLLVFEFWLRSRPDCE